MSDPSNQIPTLEHAVEILQKQADELRDNEYYRAHLHKLAYDVNQHIIKLRAQVRPENIRSRNRGVTAREAIDRMTAKHPMYCTCHLCLLG